MEWQQREQSRKRARGDVVLRLAGLVSLTTVQEDGRELSGLGQHEMWRQTGRATREGVEVRGVADGRVINGMTEAALGVAELQLAVLKRHSVLEKGIKVGLIGIKVSSREGVGGTPWW
ncbi:hypothetical protein ColKHC_06664 [Colletotrichum higginsianum]|nr:hypothetical protein ColKHC_06664 [Colletotrichum higginsianum]